MFRAGQRLMENKFCYFGFVTNFGALHEYDKGIPLLLFLLLFLLYQ